MRRSEKVLLFLILTGLAMAGLASAILMIFSDAALSIFGSIPNRFIALGLSESFLIFLAFQTYSRIFPDSPVLNAQKNIRSARFFLGVFAASPFALMSFDQIYFDGKRFELKFAEAGTVSAVIIIAFLVAIYLNTLEYNRICTNPNRRWSTRAPVR